MKEILIYKKTEGESEKPYLFIEIPGWRESAELRINDNGRAQLYFRCSKCGVRHVDLGQMKADQVKDILIPFFQNAIKSD